MTEPDPEAAREAFDARTSPSRLLRRLARRDDVATLEAVCAHRATPAAVAYALAERFPEAFARGARGHAFLADPWGQPPRAKHLRARLRQAVAPPVWIKRATVHAKPGVRTLAAYVAPALTGEPLARLAADDNAAVRAAVVLRAGLDDATMVTLACDPDARVCLAAFYNGHTPAEVKRALEHDGGGAIAPQLRVVGVGGRRSLSARRA